MTMGDNEVVRDTSLHCDCRCRSSKLMDARSNERVVGGSKEVLAQRHIASV